MSAHRGATGHFHGWRELRGADIMHSSTWATVSKGTPTNMLGSPDKMAILYKEGVVNKQAPECLITL